jgi:GSH-dependent disulfide-bond oxidoreductase
MVEGLLTRKEASMIDLYYWPTPNGHKITIMLEECGLEYKVIPVNISTGEQFTEEFLRIAPNNRMPALVDHAPVGGGTALKIFESGAMLEYLAQKTGKFMPGDVAGKYAVLQWLHWQMAGIGPMFGQAFHFTNYAPEKIDYAINRYTKEVERLLGVLDDELAAKAFVAGDYSIADMAIYPWVLPVDRFGLAIEDFPFVKRWRDNIAARPAVIKAYEEIAKQVPAPTPITDETRKIIFRQGRVPKPWTTPK